MKRSAATIGAWTVAAVIALGASGAYVTAQSTERVIRISTKKFEFTPSHVTLKKGEPVVFEFVAEDVVMGFNLADFGVRADVLPGKTTRVRFVPDRTGEFTFFCDIFCGAGHEDMAGSMTVSD